MSDTKPKIKILPRELSPFESIAYCWECGKEFLYDELAADRKLVHIGCPKECSEEVDLLEETK